jgi:hypothetical protein
LSSSLDGSRWLHNNILNAFRCPLFGFWRVDSWVPEGPFR